MSLFAALSDPAALIQAYGLWVLFAFVFLESTGIPVPGETALIAAGLYAGATHAFPLWMVIAIAFAAAVAGGAVGYAIRPRLGGRLLSRHRRWIGIKRRRPRLGDYMFQCQRGQIPFMGRVGALPR